MGPRRRDWQRRAIVTLALAPLLAVQLFVYDLTLWLLPLWMLLGLTRRTHPEARYLDGGPALGWSALLFWVTFVLGPAVQAQTSWFAQQGWLPVSVQLTLPLILLWARAVWRIEEPAGA